MKGMQLTQIKMTLVFFPCVDCGQRAGDYEFCVVSSPDHHAHLHYCKPCIMQALEKLQRFVMEEPTESHTASSNLN